MANVRVETDGRGIRTITIDREAARNALDRATLDELEAALVAARAPEVRVIVLRGAGTQAFSAGADLKELLAHQTLEDRRRHFDGVARVIRAMHDLAAPVIARVQGFALAGGCGLAVAADFTIAGESAVFGLPEIGIGLLPMVVSAPILRATGSRKVVLDLVLSGRRVKADEAVSLGLATRAVPDDRLDTEVAELAAQLASLSPAALRLGKEAVYTMAEMEYGAALRYLREMIVLTATTEDAQEGIRAFFEKAKARVDRALADALASAHETLVELLEEGVDLFERRTAAPRVIEAPAPTAIERPTALAQPSLVDVPRPFGESPSLDAVRAGLGECTRRRLAADRTQIVFGVGNPEADLLFIGEGPGEQEDLQGIPFVGRAGELLTQMIEKGLSIPRASVYICNIVKCRPPQNRTPLADEVTACRPFLDGQIDAVRPKVIVALGKPATSLLLGRDVAITRVRGIFQEYRGIPLMPTFHPAFVLRQYTPENRRLVWEDLKAALARAVELGGRFDVEGD